MKACRKAFVDSVRLAITFSAIFPLTAQSPDIADWQTKAGGKMAFEVASVKPAKTPRMPPVSFPLDERDAKTPGGRFSATIRLEICIRFAYKLSPSDKISQLPKWDDNNLFELEARAAGNPTKDQMRLMVQSLLADRFRLAAHFESREGPVFALTLVKPGQAGPKLRPHADGRACPDSFEMPAPFTPADPGSANDVFPAFCGTMQTRPTPDGALQVGSRDTIPELLANGIYALGFLVGGAGGVFDRPVVDRTGLKGRFDFTLELPRFRSIPSAAGTANSENPPSDPQATLLSALRNQLGLKLVSSRGAIRTLVIDHVELPSGN